MGSAYKADISGFTSRPMSKNQTAQQSGIKGANAPLRVSGQRPEKLCQQQGFPHLQMNYGMGERQGDAKQAPQASTPLKVSEQSPAHSYQQQKPPSTSRSTPVQKDAAREERKMAGPTISRGAAMRFMGVSFSNTFTRSAHSGRVFMGVAV